MRVTGARDSPTFDCVPAIWPVEDFNRYLRTLMDNAGVRDFAELSRLTSVNQSQFSLWRRGKTQPSRANLKRIAPTLGVPPVLLYIQAGLDAEADLDLESVPDFAALPKPFHELREVYERWTELGRGDEALRSISVLVAGLKAELGADIDRRRRDQPSGRRRAG